MNMRIVSLTLLVVLLFSCNGVKEIFAFSSVIEKKYAAGRVMVGKGFGGLLVTFENSGYNDSSDDVKQRVAVEIGKMAPQYIKSFKFNKGTVNFVKKKGTGPVTTSTAQMFDMKIQ